MSRLLRRVARLWGTRAGRRDAALVAMVLGGAALAAFALAPKSPSQTWKAPAPLPTPLPPSSGRAFYVASSGRDSDPGTRSRPWRTLGHAMRMVAGGQVAYLRAGTYVEGGALNALWWERSGSPAAPITIRGYPGEAARVVLKTRLQLEGDYLRLADLVVARNHAYSNFDHARTGDVGVWLAGRHDVLEHVEVRRGNMSGVFTSGSYDQILRSYIHDNGDHWNLDHGIYLGGSNQLVANNVIDHNFAYGVSLWPACDGCIVTSNTIVHNGRSGVIVGGPTSHVVVANNINAFNGEYGVRAFELGGIDNEVISNLDHANNAGADCIDDCGGGAAVSNELNADPRFVAARRDYRLRTGSPAIDAALPTYAPANDFGGKPRPQGAGPDVGAFER